ncbi:hypothetical protein YPPY64_0591, partial [Yersinia pestis PY-64]
MSEGLTAPRGTSATY